MGVTVAIQMSFVHLHFVLNEHVTSNMGVGRGGFRISYKFGDFHVNHMAISLNSKCSISCL